MGLVLKGLITIHLVNRRLRITKHCIMHFSQLFYYCLSLESGYFFQHLVYHVRIMSKDYFMKMCELYTE
jgi:hypothetical protein